MKKKASVQGKVNYVQNMYKANTEELTGKTTSPAISKLSSMFWDP